MRSQNPNSAPAGVVSARVPSLAFLPFGKLSAHPTYARLVRGSRPRLCFPCCGEARHITTGGTHFLPRHLPRGHDHACQVRRSRRSIDARRAFDVAGWRTPHAIANDACRLLCAARMAYRPWATRWTVSAARPDARTLEGPEPYLAEAQDDATIMAIKAAGGRGPRHHHRWRNPPRELFEPLRDRTRRHRPRQSSGSRSTAPVHPNPVPRLSAKSAGVIPSKSRTSSSCAATRRRSR